MSELSEILIEPGQSKTYFRLTLVLYLITTALIVYSSLCLVIKLCVIGFILFLWRKDSITQSPCSTLKKIQFIGNKWVLETQGGKQQHYAKAAILMDTLLFQLIEFSNQRQKKHIVLFYDQLSLHQVRLVRFKIKDNSL